MVGFPGYEVSDLGRVRRTTVVRGKVGGIIQPNDNGHGYLTVKLYREGQKPARRTVHSLVAAAFIGPRPDGHEVNHLDGEPGHNAATNLEYTTPSGNKQHALAAGRGIAGERNGQARLTVAAVREIRRLATQGIPQRQIASRFGISQPHVSDVVTGRRWRRMTEAAATVSTTHEVKEAS